ncbi:molybdopterin adenylyltransferase [Helicobacter mustelae]|uniref:Molybdopterin adenylyltransferase n=1 Tax=Helicobacter mustelae (strain ATCC 43772 / CCUG 25715 / CIP 103759 / LMG 18044 / NCTC 12198 / R85-136P) TaxID=679897 RepID=D3UHG7_HELM1|nr:molybdopterin adenylyltransferase [Helicobacter mustelae]CBG39939.1 molybdopterin biosynthesis protein [Helicobacter mustelae 12198]SQH71450.1 molybdopterin biosynthesis protein [Helicobacter mustelae]STP12577.1 molybdopterin biosynthesis protein [Helicobacter mustelae]
MEGIKIGIVTASDRAFDGIYEDISGKAIEQVLRSYILNPCEFFYHLIKDEQSLIEAALRELVEQKCDLIVTTGGTGPAPRDVTPEATQNVCEKMLPGFGELMRQNSLQYVPTAILSRQSAGICQNSLIINLPGKPKSIQECLEAVFPAIPYCIDLIGGRYIHANEANITAFRPKK